MSDTLVGLIRERAERMPEKLAYSFLLDGERELRSLSYEQLETESRRIADLISTQVAPGARVLLMFPPGLEFLCTFFGCLFAGVIAVPVYPPAPPRYEGFTRLQHVLADSSADALLTTQALMRLADVMPGVRERLGNVPWIVTDRDRRGDAANWRDPGVKPDSIAFLQYTSGSTSDPRGVVLRHEHLMANLRAMHWFLREPTDGSMISWLPMYHDMGLIGTVMYPLSRGLPCHLLSPLHFLQRPARWLELISRVHATFSGGPNFAYDLCVQRISAPERAGLDLSSWDVAFNGSEPVRADTVRRFESAFASCGLRPGTVVACYGLAEATLLVSGAHRDKGSRFLSVNRDELARGHAVACQPGAPEAAELVSCGPTPPDQEVRIVHPETGVELLPGTVGEIWFSSASVAQGYWKNPEETAACFGVAVTGENNGHYLRTGDLGFVLSSQVYVTGRLKDLLVIRGRNIHAFDVEEAVQRTDARLRAGRGVAFPVDTEDGEGVGLIQEATVKDPQELERLARLMRDAVWQSLEVTLDVIYFVAPRSVRKTSSGKLRRRATRAALDAGELTVLLVDRERFGREPVYVVPPGDIAVPVSVEIHLT